MLARESHLARGRDRLVLERPAIAHQAASMDSLQMRVARLGMAGNKGQMVEFVRSARRREGEGAGTHVPAPPVVGPGDGATLGYAGAG